MEMNFRLTTVLGEGLHKFRRIEIPTFLNGGKNPLYVVVPDEQRTFSHKFSLLKRPIVNDPLNFLMDEAWYKSKYKQAMSFVDPWTDFHILGWKAGRNPNFIFDVDYYLSSYVDVRASGMNPLVHYINHGAWEGRKPSPYFDSQYYLKTYADVAEAGMNPLYHFLASGWREGRNPSPDFDINFYLQANPDVAASGLNPLYHYLAHGKAEGRAPCPPRPVAFSQVRYVPPVNLLPWFGPLNLEIDADLSERPHLNVLVPGLAMKHMSGGPNTALNLAGRLAGLGIPVRFCSTDASIDADSAPFWAHVRRLADLGDKPITAELVDMTNRMARTSIGKNDVFMATAWWTAQMAKYAMELTNSKKFVYLIQDYEPLLHAASTPYALSQETYGLDHIGVINTKLLHDFLLSEKIGRYADEAFARTALVFNPAIARDLFYPVPRGRSGKRRLLFYARPSNGLRNLFEMGVAALQKCLFDGVLKPDAWEFIGMGEQFEPFDLGFGCRLEPAPWQGLDGYAEQMRESDVLLSLMLSPHPSYPPLEMALCGRVAVTNVYANKTAEKLADFSPNIIGVDATIEGIAGGIEKALDARRPAITRNGSGALPSTWDDAFSGIVPELRNQLLGLFGAPAKVIDQSAPQEQPVAPRSDQSQAVAPFAGNTGARAVGFRAWPKNAYEVTRFRRQAARAGAYAGGEPELISFLTTVWDTPPQFLEELAESVFNQDCGAKFEWILLDNGSSRQDTLDAMARIAQHPCVRFSRVEKNLGIVGGMRHILKLATRRYIVPLDSDDILTPDCIRIVTSCLKQNNYPALAYTDEDKLFEGVYRDPYDKPDWDPVLFFHSCYIAHLGCIDRELAVKLGVYDDDGVSGCHDYDTFTRFYLNGCTPLHIPEVVYTWRMHASSTAGNISSKSYISSSQENLLKKFLGARAPDFSVEPSKLFNGTPDWHFVRPRTNSRKMVTFLFGDGSGEGHAAPDVPHSRIDLPGRAGVADLLRALAAISDDTLCHFHWRGCRIADNQWPWEAMGLMDLFPDTVMVGGFLHHRKHLVAAPGHFGFGRGCESPDIGRSLADPGYFAQMFKEHSVGSVPIEHSIVTAGFLRDALKQLGAVDLEIAELGPWLGACAQQASRRVVYSPFVSAELAGERPAELGDGMWLAFREHFPALVKDRSLLSAGLSREVGSPYGVIVPATQGGFPAPKIAYTERARAERLLRQLALPSSDRMREPTIGLMTSVYERTDADFLVELVRSVREQISPIHEWIILENGPVSPAVADVLTAAERDLPVKRFSVEKNLGIQGAMAFCLARASAEFVSPLDADDLLEPDAIAQVCQAIGETGADLLFTDEDHIIDGVLQAPFRRGPFDPVLNAVDSYIWHLVFYRRDKALDLGLYTEAGAEYCHDWDTVTRFSRAKAHIHHIPHVLYHWRMHRVSTSGSGAANQGTMNSVEWMLKQQILTCKDPDLYRVALFPLDRGAPQLSILRKAERPLPLLAVVESLSEADELRAQRPEHVASLGIDTLLVPSTREGILRDTLVGRLATLPPKVDHLLFVGANIDWPGIDAVLEAMRLFEMHPEIGLVGGQVIDLNGRILETCEPHFRDEEGKHFHWAGNDRGAPGSFALALKPQLTKTVSAGLFFARRDVVAVALAQAQPITSEHLVQHMVETTQKLGYSCAYSPLIEAHIR